MRADAQRNRRRLLDAGCRVLLRDGVDAPLETIAREANVGIATLYRHFPRRFDLLRAVAVDVMTRTHTEVRSALEDPDAFAALRRYMHRTLDLRAPALMPLFDENVRNDPAVKALLDATAAAQAALIEQATGQGSIRAGTQFADVGLVLARFSRPIGKEFDPELDRVFAHRHLDVFIDGLQDVHDGLPPVDVTLGRLRGLRRRSDETTSQRPR